MGFRYHVIPNLARWCPKTAVWASEPSLSSKPAPGSGSSASTIDNRYAFAAIQTKEGNIETTKPNGNNLEGKRDGHPNDEEEEGHHEVGEVAPIPRRVSDHRPFATGSVHQDHQLPNNHPHQATTVKIQSSRAENDASGGTVPLQWGRGRRRATRRASTGPGGSSLRWSAERRRRGLRGGGWPGPPRRRRVGGGGLGRSPSGRRLRIRGPKDGSDLALYEPSGSVWSMEMREKIPSCMIGYEFSRHDSWSIVFGNICVQRAPCQFLLCFRLLLFGFPLTIIQLRNPNLLFH